MTVHGVGTQVMFFDFNRTLLLVVHLGELRKRVPKSLDQHLVSQHYKESHCHN